MTTHPERLPTPTDTAVPRGWSVRRTTSTVAIPTYRSAGGPPPGAELVVSGRFLAVAERRIVRWLAVGGFLCALCLSVESRAVAAAALAGAIVLVLGTAFFLRTTFRIVLAGSVLRVEQASRFQIRRRSFDARDVADVHASRIPLGMDGRRPPSLGVMFDVSAVVGGGDATLLLGIEDPRAAVWVADVLRAELAQGDATRAGPASGRAR